MYTVIIKMKIIFKSLLILLIITISANSEVIKEIKVNGNKRVSSETIKIFTEVKVNKNLNINQLNDVLKKLYSTNFFSKYFIYHGSRKSCNSNFKI